MGGGFRGLFVPSRKESAWDTNICSCHFGRGGRGTGWRGFERWHAREGTRYRGNGPGVAPLVNLIPPDGATPSPKQGTPAKGPACIFWNIQDYFQ
jgi:hypothetical protein